VPRHGKIITVPGNWDPHDPLLECLSPIKLSRPILPWVPELESVFNWDVLCLITQIAARALKTMQEPSLPPPPPIAA
jgi:hypothetical protein